MATPDPHDEQTEYAGMPAWVKAILAVVAVLVLVVVVARLSGVEHGPGRHAGPAASSPGSVRA